MAALGKGDREGDRKGDREGVQGGRKTIEKAKDNDKKLIDFYEEAMKEAPKDIYDWKMSKKAQSGHSGKDIRTRQIEMAKDKTILPSVFDKERDVDKERDLEKRSPDLIWIGEYPVLRIVSNGEQTSLLQVQLPSSHSSDLNNTVQTGRTVPPPQVEQNPTSKQEMKGFHLETDNNNNESLQGWTVVTRKKKKTLPQELRQKRNQQSLLSIHAKKLRQLRKCFRCLREGHIQAVCSNQRCCLHCNAEGHIIRDCPSMSSRSWKVTQGPPTQYKRKELVTGNSHINTSITHTTSLTPKHTLSGNPKKLGTDPTSQKKEDQMDVPRDWQSMIMNESAALWQNRPHSLNVYLAPREELSPVNLFLERSAFVFAGQGASEPYFKQRVANCMGRQFHCDASDFKIFVIDEDFGDVILIFPEVAMERAAIDRASFYIGNNIEIQLHAFSSDLQLAFDPLGGRARIRLYGIPLNHWNKIDMATLVAGFGYQLRVAPYFVNGNYQFLTMLVATKSAGEVPFWLKLKVHPHKKDIRVALDGWLEHQENHAPHPGGNNNERRGRGRRDQRDDRREGHDRHRGSPPGRRDRGEVQNRGQRNEGNRSSSGSNWTRPVQTWVARLRNQLITAGILTGEDSREKNQLVRGPQNLPIITGQTKEVMIKKIEVKGNGSLFLDQSGTRIFKFGVDGPTLYIIQRTIFDGINLISGTLISAFYDKFPNCQMRFGLLQKMEFLGDKEQGLIQAEAEDDFLGLIQVNKGLSATKDRYGLVQGQIQNFSQSQEDLLAMEMDCLDGPPPGFEAPIYKSQEGNKATEKRGCKRKNKSLGVQVRKSKRLSEKYVEERVRYNSGKKKYAKKNVKPKLTKWEYLQSLDPLGKLQAIKVVQMARVVINEGIEEQVEKIIAG